MQIVVLFNPRAQVWDDHFEASGPLVSGKTAVGRATVRLLEMNAPARLDLRANL